MAWLANGFETMASLLMGRDQVEPNIESDHIRAEERRALSALKTVAKINRVTLSERWNPTHTAENGSFTAALLFKQN